MICTVCSYVDHVCPWWDLYDTALAHMFSGWRLYDLHDLYDLYDTALAHTLAGWDLHHADLAQRVYHHGNHRVYSRWSAQSICR